MSIRSKMKFGGGLPVGGRSSGGRPKKKVKAKLYKSDARVHAEAKLSMAEFRRERLKKTKSKSRNEKTFLAKTAKKQASELKQKGRKAASRRRRSQAKTSSANLASKEAKFFKGAAAKTTPKSVAKRRASSVKGTRYDSSPEMQKTGKDLIKARKELARTPYASGKVRISSGNRNMFLKEPKLSDH